MTESSDSQVAHRWSILNHKVAIPTAIVSALVAVLTFGKSFFEPEKPAAAPPTVVVNVPAQQPRQEVQPVAAPLPAPSASSQDPQLAPVMAAPVVALEEPEASSASGGAPTSHYLVIGRYATEDQARHQSARLVLAGYGEGHISRVSPHGAFELVVGPQDDLQTLHAVQTDLGKKGVPSTLVRRVVAKDAKS